MLSIKDENLNFLNKILAVITIISAIFSLIIALFLLIYYFQMYRINPSTNRELVLLQKELKSNPNNMVLKKGIRELDYISRGAFFSTQNQLLIGRYLLLTGIIVFFVFGNTFLFFKYKLKPPDSSQIGNTPFFNAKVARNILLVAMLVTILGMVIFSHNSKTQLDNSILLEENPQNSLNSKNNIINSISIVDLAVKTKEIKENWTSFRGFNGNGITYRDNVPISWDGKSSKNILWKSEISKPGFSSPIVWKGQIFISGGDKGARMVMTYDCDSGKLLWAREVSGIIGSPQKQPAVTDDTGYAAATMCCDGNQIFAIFANGDLISYRLNGDLVWSKNLGVPSNHYGHSSSLIVKNGILVVQYDHSKNSSIMGLDSKNGNILWRSKHGSEISWASPIIVDLKDKSVVVSATSALVTLHNLKDGKELWSIDCMGGEVAPSPVYANGTIYVTNDNATTIALAIQTGKKLWSNEDLDMPDVASPIATDKYLFMATSTGILLCVDAKSGKLLWEKMLDVGFYSSPILVKVKGDDSTIKNIIYVTDMNGVTYIIELGNKYKELEKCKLDEAIVTTPAFVGNKIYIRGNKFLYAIGVKGKEDL